ncbi:hypothetical protein Hanom_Chr17g01537251 [Helianthus anomalus]
MGGGGSKTYIPKNFYRTRGSKTYIPKKFYTKTTYITLLSEKFGERATLPRPFYTSPLYFAIHQLSITAYTPRSHDICLKSPNPCVSRSRMKLDADDESGDGFLKVKHNYLIPSRTKKTMFNKLWLLNHDENEKQHLKVVNCE